MWWTFLAAIVGSATALVIAFFAYPWQKQRDRELQINLEKRQAYQEFFASLLGVFQTAQEGSEDEYVDALIVNRKHFNALAFYAPLEIVSASRAVIDKAQEYRGTGASPGERSIEVFNSALELEKTAISLARIDILGQSADASQVVKLLYGK